LAHGLVQGSAYELARKLGHDVMPESRNQLAPQYLPDMNQGNLTPSRWTILNFLLTRAASAVNRESLKKLAGLSDIEELRQAVDELCMPFGGVRSMTLSRVRNADSYLCLVSLNTPSLHSAMKRRLGGFSFGHSVSFMIPGRTKRTRWSKKASNARPSDTNSASV